MAPMLSSAAVGDTSGMPYTREPAAMISVGMLVSSPTSTPARCVEASSAAPAQRGADGRGPIERAPGELDLDAPELLGTAAQQPHQLGQRGARQPPFQDAVAVAAGRLRRPAVGVRERSRDGGAGARG